MACGRGDDAPPESVPVKTSTTAGERSPTVVHVGPNQVPVTAEAMAARWPTVQVLARDAQQRLTTSMNLVPGPCAPCIADKESLARCALRPASDGCANIPALVQRAARVAADGEREDAIREAVHYPDHWVDFPKEDGVRIGPASAEVRIDLWCDPDNPWTNAAMDTANALRTDNLGAVRIHVHGLDSVSGRAVDARATPTWAIAGYRMRGAQSAHALGRLIDREIADHAARGAP